MSAAVERHVLPNGMQVLTLRKCSAPVVSANVWYQTGSVHERPGQRGVSHLFEHMMFRGSAHVGPEEHARRINAVGGHANAFTAEDITAFTNSVPCQHLEMALELEAERMQHLSITPEVLETERQVIIEEYHTYMNNPVTKAFLEFRREFFGVHPYAVGPLGELSDLQTMDVQTCREYYETWYRPENAVVVVVGDIDSSNQVADLVERHFGCVARGKEQPDSPPETPQSMLHGRALSRRVDFDVPMQVHGYSAPASSHPDSVALDMLQQIVSVGESCRLNRALVREQSTAVFAGGGNQMLRHAGMSLLFAAFTPDMPAGRVSDAIEYEVERVCRDGVTVDEIERVRNQTLTAHTFDLYSADHLAHRIGFAETIDGDCTSWLQRLERLQSVTPEQVTHAARRYWTRDRRWSLTLRPRRVRPLLYLVGLVRRFLPRGHR